MTHEVQHDETPECTIGKLNQFLLRQHGSRQPKQNLLLRLQAGECLFIRPT